MRVLIISLVTLLLAVSAALLAHKDPGYLLIDIGGWTMETTLVLAIVCLLIAFVIGYFSLRVVASTFRAHRDLQRWRKQRKIRKANESLTHGLIMLAEGNWAAAEKRVLKYAESEPTAMLNYLAAARAAQEQGAYERRDNYLNLAHQNMPSADIAVGLTQAELQLNQKQMEQALATLRRLQQLAPAHKKVLKALAAVYVRLSDWNHLIEMIPDLRKRKVLPEEEVQQLEQTAYFELLSRSENQNYQALEKVWYHIPREVQGREAILVKYLHALVRFKKSDIAEPLIRNALKQAWSDNLVHLYGVIDCADVKTQLANAEAWLKSHENSAMLLLTLGRLCLRSGLWGKARTYLEASVGADDLPEAYNELGHLLEKLGEPDKAIACYRKGLSNTPGCEHTVSETSVIKELDSKKTVPPLIPDSSAAAS